MNLFAVNQQLVVLGVTVADVFFFCCYLRCFLLVPMIFFARIVSLVVLGLAGVFLALTGADGFLLLPVMFFFAENDDYFCWNRQWSGARIGIALFCCESPPYESRGCARRGSSGAANFYDKMGGGRTLFCWRGSRESTLALSLFPFWDEMTGKRMMWGYRSTTIDAPIGWMCGDQPKFGSVDRRLTAAKKPQNI